MFILTPHFTHTETPTHLSLNIADILGRRIVIISPPPLGFLFLSSSLSLSLFLSLLSFSVNACRYLYIPFPPFQPPPHLKRCQWLNQRDATTRPEPTLVGQCRSSNP